MAELFDGYRVASAWDEMLTGADQPRRPYRSVHGTLRKLTGADLGSRADALARTYLNQGVTFDFAGEERPFPLDVVPRVISAEEWTEDEAGVRVASAETIDQMRAQSSVDGEPDGLLHYPVRFGQGFQLGGPAVGWPAVEPFGHLSSRESFGHNGSNVCVGWADPEHGLVVVYLGSRIRGWQTDRTMLRRLADSLLAACRPRADEPTT